MKRSSLVGELLEQYDSDAALAFYRRVMGGGGPNIHYGIYPDTADGRSSGIGVREAARNTVDFLAQQLSWQRRIEPSSRLLDLGSGTGGPAVANAERFGCEVVAFNLCPHQNAQAAALAQERGLAEHLRIVEGDFDGPWLTEFEGTFDAVWSQEALCHSTDKAALLARIAASLKPGGVLAFTDIMAGEQASADDLRAFTTLNATTSLARPSDYARMIAAAGLELVSTTTLTRHLARFFEGMLEEVRSGRQALVDDEGVQPEHLERYEEALEQRIADARRGPLAWGAFVARRPAQPVPASSPVAALSYAGVTTERALGAFAGSGAARESEAAAPIVVVGAGHVGSFLARELAAAHGARGRRVILKHRPGRPVRDEVALICRAAGIELVDRLGGDGPPPHCVFLATKTFDHGEALAELERAGIRSPICAVFNGLLPEDALPGVVPCVTFGSWDFVAGSTELVIRNAASPWRLPAEGEAFAALLRDAGIAAVADEAFYGWQLRKFLVNAAANLLSVHRDRHCAGLLKHHAGELDQLIDEIATVLATEPRYAGALAALTAEGGTAALVELVEAALRSYGTHHPSTWHDHQQGRRLEVDALNGFVVSRARLRSIPVPHNRALVAAVGAATSSAEPT